MRGENREALEIFSMLETAEAQLTSTPFSTLKPVIGELAGAAALQTVFSVAEAARDCGKGLGLNTVRLERPSFPGALRMCLGAKGTRDGRRGSETIRLKIQRRALCST